MAPEEAISTNLPLNISDKSKLPSDRLGFGFSFQDVPGLRLSECRLVEIDSCRIEMVRDGWDSVYVDIKTDLDKRVKLRGMGISCQSSQPSVATPQQHWERAALPIEIWSGNYGHWLAYHLPKLMIFADNGWTNKIALPERGRWKEVEARDADYLSLVEPATTQILKLGAGTTSVAKLAVIDGDPHHRMLLRKVADQIKKRVIAETSVERRRILISRRGAGFRRLLNEDALLNALLPFGFESVSLEGLNLATQIQIFAHAECVVGMHGSGLANMIYCPDDASVIEIIPDEFPGPDFYRLANTLELKYYLLFGESVGDGQRGQRDMVAPVDVIESLVRNSGF